MVVIHVVGKEDIYGSFLVGSGVVIKEAHNALAEVIERVLHLTRTGDELVLGKMYFGEVAAEEIEV